MKDDELIKGLKQGDTIAFARLYDRYCSKVYRFVQLYVKSEVIIADITQDVFIRMWEARAMLDESQDLDGLLFITTRNKVFTHFAHRQREEEMLNTLLKGELRVDSFEDELEAEDLEGYIETLIAALPPRRQEIFRLSREQHLSNKEIAERMQISEKGVERQMTIALRTIKECLPLLILIWGR
ncbi:MAG: RNA polymerase sigma-70 factor [Mediterranea sp.]|jgi:RNA polymerase sigma-70 factor (ECF subfamily)|nr:RNA polymerase sigma-70 factor [Mediterranea sp.]